MECRWSALWVVVSWFIKVENAEAYSKEVKNAKLSSNFIVNKMKYLKYMCFDPKIKELVVVSINIRG